MSGSRMARSFDLPRGMQRDQQRVRRLEVNTIGRPPLSGAAEYFENYAGSYAATQSIDFTGATKSFDTIGCTLGSFGAGQDVILPSGWVAWGNVHIVAQFNAAAPTGEALLWGVQNSAGSLDGRSDVVSASGAGASMDLGANIPLSPNPTEFIRLTGGPISVWKTLLGTPFRVTSITINIIGVNTNLAAYTS